MEKFIPPLTCLQKWRAELDLAKKLAKDSFYIESTIGRFDLSSIQNSVSLLSAAGTKKAVIEEIDWFNSKRIVPKSVKSSPPITAINNFKSLIFNHTYCEMFNQYSMSPAELSGLCCKRYISGDHVRWIINQLNNKQSEVLCIYMNSIIDIVQFVDRALQKRIGNGIAVPTKVVFVLNVGKYSDGSTYLGSDSKMGNHWSICTYDPASNVLIYGDSLGWSVPVGFLEKAYTYLDRIYNAPSQARPQMKVCHDCSITDSSGRHKCDPLLCSSYPLQTCYNVCGVVALMVTAIYCLCPEVYVQMTSIQSIQSTKRPYMFLQEPSKYNKYLRLCLASWFSEENINIDYIVPNINCDVNEVSDSDEDMEIERLDNVILPSLEKKATDKNSSQNNIKELKQTKTAAKENNQHSKL